VSINIPLKSRYIRHSPELIALCEIDHPIVLAKLHAPVLEEKAVVGLITMGTHIRMPVATEPSDEEVISAVRVARVLPTAAPQ
jgi:hypothetical protein